MPSLRSRIAVLALRTLGVKRWFADLTLFQKSIAKSQSPGIDKPPWFLNSWYQVSSSEYGGWTCYTVSPKVAPAKRHVLYLHGGAYVHQIMWPHWQLVGQLVEWLGCEVTVPIYPLAPSHGFRDVFPILLGLYGDLLERTHPAKLAVIGDSAGAGMALALAQQLKAQNLTRPKDLVLISPWLDITMSNPEIEALDLQDSMLSPLGLVEAGRMWAQGEDPNHPLLSPINGDLTGLGQVSVFIGTQDLFLADCRRLRALMGESGAALNYHEYEGMFHVWVAAVWLPESVRAIREIAEIVEREVPTVPGF